MILFAIILFIILSLMGGVFLYLADDHWELEWLFGGLALLFILAAIASPFLIGELHRIR